MSKRTAGIGVALTLLLGVAPLEAQLSTERFIPVGQSPGLSGVVTYIGQVVSVDEQNMTLTAQTDGQSVTIQLTSETHLWLDRSALREANATGTLSDLQAGRTVEVKYIDAEDPQAGVDWIKIAIE